MGNIKDKEIYEQELDNLGIRTKAHNIVKMLIEQEGLDLATRQAEQEDFAKLMYDVLRRVRQIPLDKTVSPRRIQDILKADNVGFDLNIGADLHAVINDPYNRVRFYEYSQQLLKAAQAKGVRGHYFEGLLAGLFNGKVVSAMEGEMVDPKEDVVIDGTPYSAKLVRIQDKMWDSGSLFGGWKQAIIQLLLDKGIDPTDFKNTPFKVEDLTKKLYELIPEGDPDRDTYQFRHMELFLKDAKVDIKYKRIILDHAFTSKSEEEEGEDLHWIFGLIWGDNENFEGEDLPKTNLKYYLIDTPSLIDGILNRKIHFTKGRNNKMIRIAEKSMIGTNGASPHFITFPKVTRQDLEKLLYDEEEKDMVYKVMGVFKQIAPESGIEKYMHHKIADVIADKPKEFIEKLRIALNIKEEIISTKLINEIGSAESYDVITHKLWSVTKLALEISSYKQPGGVKGFEAALTEFFYINNSEQIAVLWLIIEYNKEKYGLSGIEVVNLPIEKIKVPETIWETEYYYKGEESSSGYEEECENGEGNRSGEECDCEKYEDIEVYDKEYEAYDEVPCIDVSDEDRKKAGYDDESECLCDEWGYKEVEEWYYPTLYSRTFALIEPEPISDIDELVFHQTTIIEHGDIHDYNDEYGETWEYFREGEEGEVEDVSTEETGTSWYIKELNFKLYDKNIQETLTEESDIFGQGLLDPIDQEEFDGDDEEWEELVSDVEDEDFEVEPEYEYSGGKTDAEKGFVAPSNEVTDNICNVEGICNAQGPITFGQLKALVEEATKKRIAADMGRGVFKTLWRVIPFFMPQVLLASVGITVTRAINKIVTPALKDTRGYKSWWGKAVLKAMDVAEGDYIPDVAIGDDPLSKIFFISDGLLQMIRDKYKLKFARYVAEVASAQPNDKPVPEWFVENLLRDYLNQKFLLDPPLQIKRDIEKKKIDEAEVEVTEPKEEYEQFTKLEITILNYIVTQFTRTELQLISSTDWSQISSEVSQKYGNYLKYFGIDASDGDEEWAKGTRFAKWITDNWTEAEVEMDGGGYSHDFGKVTNPIKDWPNMYSVMGNETGWEKAYKSGEIEIPAYDEDDALDRAQDSWWEYEPDMETYDWGDYESDDFEVDDSSIEFQQSLKEHTMSMDDDDHIKIDLEKFGNILVKAFFSKEGGWGRQTQRFVLYMTPSGIIKAIKQNSNTSKSSIPFIEGEKVNLGSLIRFEKESGFDLRMKGRLRESIKTKRIIESINKWVRKEYNLVLDHNNTPTFLTKNTEKLNTYNQLNNLVCEIWGKNHNYNLNVRNFEVKNIDITNKNHNNLVFENLNNVGVELPLDTLKHYLNKNIKDKIKDNIVKDKNINLHKLQENLVKLGFIKEDQPKQRVVLEWLNDVIKETNKNGVITEEGKIKYVDNLIESYDTKTPHGLGVPNEVFLSAVETLKPEVLKDLKPYVNEFMYYCLGFEEMKPEDSEDWYSMGREEGFDVLIHRAGYSPFETVEDVLSDSCSGAYNSIWDIMRELERKLKNMGILEPRVKIENGEKILIYPEDHLPDSLFNLYTQLFSEIDDRLKSSRMGMPMANKKAGGETKLLGLGEDSPRAHSYSGGRHTNPHDVEVRDIIRLIHMDDPQGIAVGTYGTVVGFDSDPWEKRILVVWDLPNGEKRNLPLYPSIDTWMLHKKGEQINEQMSQEDIDKQLTLFPTGKWEFTAHEDPSDAKFVEKTISEDLIKILFNKWDEDGINLKIFKYLGIPPSDLVVAYVVKRYLQNTKKPVPVSYTFNCDDLAELFDTHSNDYDFGYIKEYLCGDESFWEPSEWFQYEWYDGMLDDLDEENWKTISSIFGGVSQEVAEHILSKQPQNEEEEELIEKYEEEISDIKHFIMWANNDAHEDAVKSAMIEGIDNELATHFQEEGRLVTDNNGKKNWVIEGDLRGYVNDQWDNTDTFEFHSDRMATVLEDIIMDLGITYFKPDTLFGYLMEEEFMFGEYCEGKKGDCLQPETKFFDGYWSPNYNINEVVADRLQELTYESEFKSAQKGTIKENRNVPHWDLYQLLTRTSNIDNNRKRKVFDFLNVLQNLGLVNMYQSPDFLWSGSKWLTKYLDLYHPELLDEPDEDIEKDDDGYWDNDRIKHARYLLDNADTVRDTVLMMLIDSTEDQDSIKVETQMRPFAADLFKLWAQIK